MNIYSATVGMLALGTIAAAGNAATIVNGSFEQGTNPGATFSTLAAGSNVTGADSCAGGLPRMVWV